jgi:hypothetical protein
MWLHPDSIGANMVTIFPEIFDSYEFMHFCLALNSESQQRTDDYFASTDFLFGSQARKDLSKLFSAIQRLYGDEHKDFQAYVSEHANQLINLPDTKTVKTALKQLHDVYNGQYGMARQVKDFYTKYLSDDDKQLLLGKFPLLSTYKPNVSRDVDAQLGLRLDILLRIRHRYNHAATYVPLSNGDQPMYMRIEHNGKLLEWPITLTFENFYEVTRKAMAQYWLAEYRECLKNGGKQKIDKRVREIKQENKKLNEARKVQKLVA